MKDVIYWAAEAWQGVQESSLRKAWSKILNAKFLEDNEVENIDLAKYFKKIPGCQEVTEEDIEKWVTSGDDGQLDLDDQDIANFVLENDDDEEDEEGNHEIEEAKVNSDEAFSALETSLRFIEQQPGVTPQELLIFRKWRNIAAENRVNAKKHQSLITEFFKRP